MAIKITKPGDYKARNGKRVNISEIRSLWERKYNCLGYCILKEPGKKQYDSERERWTESGEMKPDGRPEGPSEWDIVGRWT